MLSLAELRNRHPTFYFDQVVLEHRDNDLIIYLKYHLENGPDFITTWCFPGLSQEKIATKDEELIKAWAAQLGMVEGLSYWKTACSPTWVVKVPGITNDQLPFWQNLLHEGMSEFFFIHQINGWHKDFVNFDIQVSEEDQRLPQVNQTTHSTRLLVPIGGGKDSVVTVELMRKMKMPITTFNVEAYAQPYIGKVIDTFWSHSEDRSHLQVQRRIDVKKIHDLNEQGYWNGHTPFSAMLAFSSTLCAYLYDYQYVPLSNEWSANEGSTVFLGQSINHQYSKSLDFETQFRDHLSKYLSSTIEYFSFLRPLHELQIAKLFTHYPAYLPIFLSCNRGQSKSVWCGECPKCVFVSIMFSAFLDQKQLLSIFHKDILDDEKLKDIFDQLAGFTEVKSLECVGTREETRGAIALAMKHLSAPPKLLSYGWKRLNQETNNGTDQIARAEKILSTYVDENFLPTQFAEVMRTAVDSLTITSQKNPSS